MKEKIFEILNGIHPEYNYKESSNFIEDGMLDSFDVVTLITELEDTFSICIDGEDVVPENFSSAEAIVNIINRSEKI